MKMALSKNVRALYDRCEQNQINILGNMLEDYQNSNKRNLIEHISVRVKSDKSIIEKCHNKKIDITDENIMNNISDIVGARIVCPFLSDVKKIIEDIKNNPNLEIIDEKDYIKEPKPSGYQSYHMRVYNNITIDNKKYKVKSEIQVRTILMDLWASLEHKIFYKKGIELSEETKYRMHELATFCQILDQELEKKKTNSLKEQKDFDNIINKDKYERMIYKYKIAMQHALIEIEKLNTKYKYTEQDMTETNPIEHIKSRIKPSDSLIRKIYNKMQEGPIASVEDVISDIAGIRIVCLFKDDLYRLKEEIENNCGFEVVGSLCKNYVENPKENGYAGYHIVVNVPYYHKNGRVEKVKVEIQIRTIAMDMWAIVERNLRYKDISEEERNRILAELARIRIKIDDTMSDIYKESQELQNIKRKVLK